MKRLSVVILFAASALAASSCSSSDEPAAAFGSVPPPPTSELTTTSSTSEPAISATTSEAGSPEMPEETQDVTCYRLADFADAQRNQQWLVVNDDVMGGRSSGEVAFQSERLIFKGKINTNGGGFSSLRLPLEASILNQHSRIEFRARPDDRSYMVTFDDDLATRDRRVSHRAPIEFTSPGEWQTVSVAFDELFPAIFGQPIDDLPFRKDLANRLGLMISDGIDGSFRLEIDWIDLCP